METFCSHFLEQATRSRRLERSDHEDALAWLISETWRISAGYDPARGWSFSKYAYRRQGHFLVQWYRDRWVDQRYSFGNAERRDAIAFALSLDLGDDGMVTVHDGSSEADGLEDGRGLVVERDRERAGDVRAIREGLLAQGAAGTEEEVAA